ncbi:hypothetical protein MM440_11355 [Arsenicicoccus piscis]|uniref:SLC13 family permease n=2 Tax=Arsenicicoccus piscis TaxID=673954 RepID=UPI001F4D03E3|nr:hypothetical protein [Arsenicicoccus piscis]
MLTTVGGVKVADAFSFFPTSLIVLIIGVTMLFAHAERSGAVTWLVDRAFRLIRGRAALIPWIGFVVGAALATMGAFPTAPISLLLPILALLAMRHRLSYPLLAVICVLGSNAAGLSPLSPAGATVLTICRKQGVHYSPWLLYAIVMLLHVVLVALLLLLHRMLRHSPRWRRFMHIDHLGETLAQHADAADLATAPSPLDRAAGADNRSYRVVCLISLLGFVLVVLVLKLDVGLVALAFALALQLAFATPEAEIIKRVPWNVVLLLGGLVIYFGVMGKVGTLKAIEHGLGSIGSMAVLLLLLVYITGLVSNMESSTLATLGVMVPIGMGALAHGAGGSPLFVLVAIVMSAAVVVMNPVHIAGALIIANAEESRRERMFRDLLVISFSLTAVVPGLMAVMAILATG